ncbi:MAG: HEAT repeat domain-containing protein, partial [Planctomycetota bacterium]
DSGCAMKRLICCIVISVLLIQCTKVDDADERALRNDIRKLGSTVRYERQQAIAVLRQANTATILRVFKQTFPMLRYEGRYAFSSKVLPHLPTEHVDTFLLKEFRANFPIQLRVQELQQRAQKEGESYELELTYEQLGNDYEWWRWVVSAKEYMGYVQTYDEIYGMMLKLNERGFPLSSFARSLHQRDPKRAKDDFTELLFHPDRQMKRHAFWALEAAHVVPPTNVVLEFFRSADVALLDETDQFVHIRNMAEYRLRRISHLTRSEADKLVAGAATPSERSKAWRRWWAKHKSDSDEALRNRAAAALAEEARQNPTEDILRELARYGDYAGVYPIFLEAISSSDINLRRTAFMQLGNMAARGHAATADVLIEHCQKLAPEDFSEFAECLARVKDDRIESLFLKVLEAQPGEDTMWKRRVARAIGQAGHNWALQPLVQLIIEDGSGNAAAVLTHVEGAEQAVPQLLEAMVKEIDHNRRHAIRSAIESTGAKGLAQRLTKVLPQVAGHSAFKGGPRYDVLKLMEFFPDPDAKPLLLKLLKSKDPWDILGAARVLGKLGDYSGAERLIENLQPTKKISASYFNSHIGEALHIIGAPDTRRRLEAHFAKADLKVKKLTLHVMAQQGDPAYLPFLEKQLTASDPEVSSTARYEIGYLIYVCNQDRQDRIDMLDEKDLPPIRTMMLWAFFDQKIIEGDRSYPDHQLLSKLKGAVVRVSRYQHIEFTTADRSLKLLSVKRNGPLTAGDGTRAGRQQLYAGGQIERAGLGKYMTIFLHLNYGGASYLFKPDGEKWQPVGTLGGVIE